MSREIQYFILNVNLWSTSIHARLIWQILWNKVVALYTIDFNETPKQQKRTNYIRGRMSHIRFQYSIAFVTGGDVKILLPESLINLNVTIRPLLHPKVLVWPRAVILQIIDCFCPLKNKKYIIFALIYSLSKLKIQKQIQFKIKQACIMRMQIMKTKALECDSTVSIKHRPSHFFLWNLHLSHIVSHVFSVCFCLHTILLCRCFNTNSSKSLTL